MITYRYSSGGDTIPELLQAIANVDGWKAELNNRTLYISHSACSNHRTMFEVTKGDTASFCEELEKHAKGSPLYRAVYDGVANFIQVIWKTSTEKGIARENRLMSENRRIVEAICGGDKDRANALMVERELNG